MINHISDKCMSCGPEFHPPTICQRSTQLNYKHVSNKKVYPNGWKTKQLISQHNHQYTLYPVSPETKCTEPISEDQQKKSSHLFSYFYENYSTKHEPPPGTTSCSPCITYVNDNIETTLKTESLIPHITEFQAVTPTRFLFLNIFFMELLFHY